MYREFELRRRPAAQSTLSLPSRPPLAELIESIRKLSAGISTLLMATGIFSILAAVIVSIGAGGAASEEAIGLVVGAVFFGTLQLWLSRHSANYAHSLAHYLREGETEKWVEIFVRQRRLAICVAVGSTALLFSFTVGFLLLVFDLVK